MEFSRAARALPVVSWLALAAPLAAQARYRVTTDGAWFHQEAGGKRLARLVRGAVLGGAPGQGDWASVTLEGWIFATSVGPATRPGYDLAVARAPDENLRAAPAGSLLAKLPQGFLLSKAADGSTDRWIHVTRTGWVRQANLEPVAEVAGARSAGTAADSGGLAAGLSPGTTGSGRGAAAPLADTAATASAPLDPSRLESARRTVLYRAPEGPLAGTLAPSAPLRVLGRSGDWTRVQLEGWVKSADLESAPPGVLLGVSAAELRTDPQRYAGQMLRWTLQFIALEQSDGLRPDIPPAATYFLARGPLPEHGFVYVIVPEAKAPALQGLAPLTTIQVTARVRTGRSRFLGNPVLDLVSLEVQP